MSICRRGGFRQRGVVLIVALVMLLLVTLLGVASSNMVRTNLKIASNIEARSSLRNAALSAVNQAIAYGQLLDTSLPPFPNTCRVEAGNNRTTCIDVTGDGIASPSEDVVVELSLPACIAVVPVRNDELQNLFTSQLEQECFRGSGTDLQTGAEGPQSNLSYCVDVSLEIEAFATDAVTGGRIAHKFGFTARATQDDVETLCSL